MKKLFFLSLIILEFIVPCHLSHGAEPTRQLKKSVDGLVAALKNQAYTRDSRLEEVKKIMGERFDFAEISKRILGREWRKLNQKERVEFVEIFKQLLEKTYMNSLDKYSNEKILFDKERILTKNKVIVETRFITIDKEIPSQYSMIRKGEEWKVYDIKIEGVSLVGNYRSQFRQIIRRDSYEDLILQLKNKIASLSH